MLTRLLSTFRRLLFVLIITVVCAGVFKAVLKPSRVSNRNSVGSTASLIVLQSGGQQASPATLKFINSVAKTESSLKQALHCTNLTTKDAANYCSHLWQRRINFSKRTKKISYSRKQRNKSKRTINVAAIACEERGREEVIVMLKSVLLFGQENHIHAHVFSDNRTAASLGTDLMELKWTAEALNWSFTFALHMEWFPAGVPWREMWQPCATQRLFFPSLLPHVDSLLYIDADMIVLSNLTEIWNVFEEMDDQELVAVAPNSEAPPDEPRPNYANRAIPFYGQRGLNAGFMLMNLTRMRRVDMEGRAIAAYQMFKEKIFLADQDLYNIIFNAYPEWIYPIDCTYNLYWRHCQEPPNVTCVHDDFPEERNCFCYPVLELGVRIIHGNMGTFRSVSFLKDLYEGFKKMDLLARNAVHVIKQLQQKFDSWNGPPLCSDLTSALLYRNALRYLQSV